LSELHAPSSPAEGTYDVVIVGGGIVGWAIANALMAVGASVVVIDPDPGGGASFGNAGLVTSSYCIPISTPRNLRSALVRSIGGKPPFDLGYPLSWSSAAWLMRLGLKSATSQWQLTARALHALAIRSTEIYRELNSHLSLGLQSRGWLWLYRCPNGMRSALEYADVLTPFGVRVDVVDAASVAKREPNLAGQFCGGLFFKDDCDVDPHYATVALQLEAMRRGARLVAEPVTDAEQAGGSIIGVRTPSTTIRGKSARFSALT
jgi:D-amino-acid dehydrogenase